MKVCFIDTWLALENFGPIHKALKLKGIDSMLIHTSSFDSSNIEKKEQIINGMLCRDISFYNTRFIYNAIKFEKPDVILNLTSFYILDRAINYICRTLDITSIFLMPGTREIDLVYIENEEYHHRFKQLNSQRLSRAKKYLLYTIPNYFYSGFKYNKYFLFSIEPWKSLIQLFLNPAKKAMYPTPSSEIHADKALVFSDVYKLFFKTMYGYKDDKIVCVGNPKLDGVFEYLVNPPKKEKINKLLIQHSLPREQPFISFFTSPFVESGYKGWTREFRVREYKRIQKIVNKYGYHLVLKLHPSMFNDQFLYDYGEEDGVTVVDNIDTPLLTYLSSSVLGHSSSTLLLPIVYGKALIIIRWESCAFINDRFSEYGVSYLSTDNNDLEKYISNIDVLTKEQTHNKKRDEYIDKYIQFKDNQSMSRIVDELISNKKGK